MKTSFFSRLFEYNTLDKTVFFKKHSENTLSKTKLDKAIEFYIGH